MVPARVRRGCSHRVDWQARPAPASPTSDFGGRRPGGASGVPTPTRAAERQPGPVTGLRAGTPAHTGGSTGRVGVPRALAAGPFRMPVTRVRTGAAVADRGPFTVRIRRIQS